MVFLAKVYISRKIISWVNNQDSDKPIFSKAGMKWHFKTWMGNTDNIAYERIFYWNEDKSESGLIELKDSDTLHVSSVKQKIIKLINNQELRSKYRCELRFPIHKHY